MNAAPHMRSRTAPVLKPTALGCVLAVLLSGAGLLAARPAIGQSTADQSVSPPQPAQQAAPLQLNTPSVPIAPASTAQPPSTVLDTPGAAPPADKSALSSPVPPARMFPMIRVGSLLAVKLTTGVSSGTQRNGDVIHFVLTTPVTLSNGVTLTSGTTVDATVVSSARAGTIGSAGVLSLQLTRVGGHPVITDVVDFTGQEGHKDVADSAPARGTEAVVHPGTLLQFHVLEKGKAPGLEPGARLPAKKP